MEKGKIIVIEGTDCSGKETQSKMLESALTKEGIETFRTGFPCYDTPTGRIVGLPYLGKPHMVRELIMETYDAVMDKMSVYIRGSKHEEMIANMIYEEIISSLSHGWFKEGAPNVDPKVSSMYYAIDRMANIDSILEQTEQGKMVILDRYIYSNLAHQGGKILDAHERRKMYEWLMSLELGQCNLPDADIKIFLHMPALYTMYINSLRDEAMDENEANAEFVKNSEKAFLEVASMYGFDTVSCLENPESEVVEPSNIRSRESISEEVKNKVLKRI